MVLTGFTTPHLAFWVVKSFTVYTQFWLCWEHESSYSLCQIWQEVTWRDIWPRDNNHTCNSQNCQNSSSCQKRRNWIDSKKADKIIPQDAAYLNGWCCVWMIMDRGGVNNACVDTRAGWACPAPRLIVILAAITNSESLWHRDWGHSEHPGSSEGGWGMGTFLEIRD